VNRGDGARRSGDLPTRQREHDLAAIRLVPHGDDRLAPAGRGRAQVVGGRAGSQALIGLGCDSGCLCDCRRRLPCAQQWAREHGFGMLRRERGAQLPRLFAARGCQRAQVVGLAGRGLGVADEK